MAQSSVGHPGGHRGPKVMCSKTWQVKPQSGRCGGLRGVWWGGQGEIAKVGGQHSSRCRRMLASEEFFLPSRVPVMLRLRDQPHLRRKQPEWAGLGGSREETGNS